MFTMTTVSRGGSAQFSLGSGVCDGRRCREKRHRAAKENAGHHEVRDDRKDMVGRSDDCKRLAVTHQLEDSRKLAQVMASVVTTIRVRIYRLNLKGTRF